MATLVKFKSRKAMMDVGQDHRKNVVHLEGKFLAVFLAVAP